MPPSGTLRCTAPFPLEEQRMLNNRDRDPGDAVPPEVAAKYPPPMTKRDRDVKRNLERLGKQPRTPGEATGPEHRDAGNEKE